MSAGYSLALDCSTARGSVAWGGVWSTEFTAGRGHGGAFFEALERALKAMDGPIEEIIVGLGPGSYSGVRQAIAAASGLSVGAGARIYGVPSPLAVVTDAPAFHVVTDARRGTFYHTKVQDGVCVAGPELVADRAALDRLLTGLPVLAVECALEMLPPGATTAWPAAERLLTSAPGARRLPPLEPIYLRAPAITLPNAPG
jgi:tRNA threonylcarbamoyl adenosine modification protein YeaZ